MKREKRIKKTNTKINKKVQPDVKDDEIFDYDNEIVIGLKVMPKPEIKDEKKKNKLNKIKNKNNNQLENKKNKVTNEKSKKIDKKVRKNNKKIKNKTIQKKKKLILKISKWTILIAFLLSGFTYLLLSPIFNIKEIDIIGSNKISKQTIISLSQINIDENIFKINKKEVINKIKENAYIESVKISRKLFSKIEIHIQERKSTFMLRFGNGYVYINNQGYILEISSEKIEVPIIEGIKTEVTEFQPGNRLCVEDLKKLEMVLKIVEVAQNNEIYELITSVDISDDSNYKLIFNEEQKIAYVGDCSILGTRILYLKTILQEEEGNPGEIFVDMDLNNNEYPFFREQV